MTATGNLSTEYLNTNENPIYEIKTADNLS